MVGEITAARNCIGWLVALILCMQMISTSSAARMDLDSMDYDQLLALLADSEAENDAEPDAPRPSVTQPSMPQPTAGGGGMRAPGGSLDISFTKPSLSGVLAPHVEVLHIIESFLRLKGEMATRIHALINDNFDLLQSIYNVLVRKAGKLHSFTLTGISVIRRILEFAVQMVGTWELNSPSVSLDVNKVFNAFG